MTDLARRILLALLAVTVITVPLFALTERSIWASILFFGLISLFVGFLGSQVLEGENGTTADRASGDSSFSGARVLEQGLHGEADRLEFPRDNVERELDWTAFAVNRLGLNWPIPLSFDVSAGSGGVQQAYLHAQSVLEASEVLMEHIDGRLCVFDVKVSVGVPKATTGRDLEEMICDCHGVNPVAVDGGVALIQTSDLQALVRDMDHWSMKLLQVDDAVQPETALELAPRAWDLYWSDNEGVLESLPQSRTFLSSHDDCYLWIESRSESHLRDHLRCLLKYYVSTRLDTLVEMPPPDLAEEYLAHHSSLTIQEIDAVLFERERILRMMCSDNRFTLKSFTRNPIVAWISVDIDTMRWELKLGL